MQLVDCIGPPALRGKAHGETLRNRIGDALAAWEAATMAALGDHAPACIDAYCARLLSETRLIDRARELTPGLVEEVEGIATGADQPFDRIAAYNLMDEQWWYDTTLATPPPGCSLIAQPIAGGHVLAQNMDLPGFMDGSQVALRLGGPDMPGAVVLSSAGLIGLTGATEAGLAVGVNTLLMLRHRRDGLPVAFAMRHALGARDGAAARDRLAQVPHASGQHYAIVTRDGFTSLECAANGAAPVAVTGRLDHTNHPLASDDIDADAQARLERAGFNASSEKRLDWLRAQEPRDTAEVKDLFDATGSPICMRPETHRGSATFASVLYELRDSVRVRMRRGPAGGAAWSIDLSL